MLYINKSPILGASLITVALLLSSCGGGSSSDTSVAVDTTETVTGTTTDTADGTPPVTVAEVQNAIDVSSASLVSDATKVTGGVTARSNSDFTFPETNNVNGAISMTIPSSAAPDFAARRTIIAGNGATVGFGDSVVLKYDMFSWEGGQLVESSSLFAEAYTVEAGVSKEYPMPDYLAKSLLGRSLGETIQVILPVGTADLPDYLDPTDAYVLLVELM